MGKRDGRKRFIQRAGKLGELGLAELVDPREGKKNEEPDRARIQVRLLPNFTRLLNWAKPGIIDILPH